MRPVGRGARPIRPLGRRGRRLRGPSRRSARVRRQLRGRRRAGASTAARERLRGFRQATIVAVALTGLLLLFLDPGTTGVAQQGAQRADSVAVIDSGVAADAPADSLVKESAEEAATTLRGLWNGFVGNSPKYGIALGVLLLAWLITRLIRPLVRLVLGHWPRADAVVTLLGTAIWLLGFGIAFSILLGDVRALVGSVGLVGLALSWALQTPIESFTGWLLNSFHGYYRVGDRIAVGEVFGDVYRIDFLTTTVWEYGGASRPPGEIHAEQPTGRLITFPNNEVLSGSVVNYTRDFPYVWDEMEVVVANESDLRYALEVVTRVADEVVAAQMAEPALRYQEILRRAGLESGVADRPTAYVSLAESWTALTVRYLVGAREKRRWKSELTLRTMEELARPEHRGRIIPVYPRRQVQLVDADGHPTPPAGPGGGEAG